MRRLPSRSGRRHWGRRLAALGARLAVGVATSMAIADEGGVSFWLPGQFASSHWLRMPPQLLARHLLRKSLSRASE
jgi:hypothetical protein